MGFVSDVASSVGGALFDPFDVVSNTASSVSDYVTGAPAAEAAEEAAALQAAAGRDATANLRLAQLEAAARQQPFEQFGIEQGIEQLPGSFERLQGAIDDPSGAVLNNPFFQALAGQQEQRLMASQAARGKFGSGETGDDLQRNLLLLGNQFAQQNIGNIQGQIQNQFNASTIGQNAATQTGVSGLQTAGNIGGIMGNVANAQAAGVIGQQQAQAGGLGNLMQLGGLIAAPFTGGSSLGLSGLGSFFGGGGGASTAVINPTAMANAGNSFAQGAFY